MLIIFFTIFGFKYFWIKFAVLHQEYGLQSRV